MIAIRQGRKSIASSSRYFSNDLGDALLEPSFRMKASETDTDLPLTWFFLREYFAISGRVRCGLFCELKHEKSRFNDVNVSDSERGSPEEKLDEIVLCSDKSWSFSFSACSDASQIGANISPNGEHRTLNSFNVTSLWHQLKEPTSPAVFVTDRPEFLVVIAHEELCLLMYMVPAYDQNVWQESYPNLLITKSLWKTKIKTL